MRETKCGFVDGPQITGRAALVAHGPTLLVDIGFDPGFDPAAPMGPPALAETKLWALVDTGATESCIDSDLAMKLQLPIVDQRKVGGVSGIKEVNMHLAHIHIPTLAFTLYGAFAGVDLIAGGQLHYALIGRTFLQQFKMVYDGLTGDVTLTA
jgi:predicted aspartyl protease